eukprot:gnl/TRDRNA2_/TRDRNA2_155289_c0_seq1.p1 gnl/TRDRNA2_/TRDRNA2_155289_c0~~gnl/TRDRNA2_/TRDRNA2_155289_c0_seq1.p1  ORF type:complete len:313 (-),score=56.54 gnl/TRDRNA2_/TRDRNA2_155289_c0_seq1:77-991(-)
MSAWLQFECGWQELVKYPTLSTEYQTLLDFHAFGITALQVLAAMMSIPPDAEAGTDGDKLPEEVHALQAAWEKYWEDATHYWERLLDTFRHNKDQNALKVWCIDEGVHNVIGRDLYNLRNALREVGEACKRTALIPGVGDLFGALLELVSAGGGEDGIRPPSWQVVRALVEEAEDTPGAGTGNPPESKASQSMPAAPPPAIAKAAPLVRKVVEDAGGRSSARQRFVASSGDGLSRPPPTAVATAVVADPLHGSRGNVAVADPLHGSRRRHIGSAATPPHSTGVVVTPSPHPARAQGGPLKYVIV